MALIVLPASLELADRLSFSELFITRGVFALFAVIWLVSSPPGGVVSKRDNGDLTSARKTAPEWDPAFAELPPGSMSDFSRARLRLATGWPVEVDPVNFKITVE